MYGQATCVAYSNMRGFVYVSFCKYVCKRFASIFKKKNWSCVTDRIAKPALGLGMGK